MPSVARRQLPTPAALSELALLQARTPRTGFSVQLHRPPALHSDIVKVETEKSFRLHRHDLVLRQGMSASPAFALGTFLCSPRVSVLDRTPGLHRTKNTMLPYKRSVAWSGLLRRAPIELDKPLSWHPARRVSVRRVATPQFLSSVDETEIPGPAVPVWRNQLRSLFFPVGIPVFERMRFA